MFFLTMLFAIIKTTLLLLVLLLIGTKIYQSATKKSCKCKTRLDGKVVLITGGNSGLGLETARDLAKRGARVIIASRDKKKSAQAVEDIIETTGNKKVEYRYLNLAKFSNIRKFAEDFNSSVDRLDILINNAGCAGLKHSLTEDGINIVMQINYFGPFLLTNLLLKKLIDSRPSRIVIVASLAHIVSQFDVEDIKGHKEIPYFRNYANSKLCNILWTKALARELPDGVTANTLHPGIVETNIFSRLGPILSKIVVFLIGSVFKTAEEGAQTSIHLAVAEKLVGKTGGYYTDCERSWVSYEARDPELIDKVWKKSLVITGSEFKLQEDKLRYLN